ncbi:hypothetical protein KKF05_03160 [Patescibacteria group bacterium]|nr:hypothetical protein [Patescibacteria group bacterium]MBU1029569.1 hypothetical protein [Patescibacteria group bacterium]MBU1915710.1 hypothetical protein [Patescibacteria group bacterium]
MRSLATGLALSVFLWLDPAQAEEAVENCANSTTEVVQPRSLELSLLFETDTLLGGDSERNYFDVSFMWRLRGELWRRLTIEVGLGFINAGMDLYTPSDTPLDATLDMPWRAVIGASARLLIYSWGFLDITLFAEFVLPVSQDPATITAVTFYDELDILNLMDFDDFRSWVTVQHRWHRVEIGLTVRGIIGRWRPFVDIKYVHLPGRIDLELDYALEAFLSSMESAPATSYDASFMSVYYAIGFEVELGAGFELELRVAASPTSNDGWAFVGRCVLEIPLTARPRRNWSDEPVARRRH